MPYRRNADGTYTRWTYRRNANGTYSRTRDPKPDPMMGGLGILLILLAVGALIGGVAAVVHVAFPHRPVMITGAAAQADAALCGQISMTDGDPSDPAVGHTSSPVGGLSYGFPTIRQAERGASPDLVALVNQLEAAYADSDGMQETQVLSEVEQWCANRGF